MIKRILHTIHASKKNPLRIVGMRCVSNGEALFELKVGHNVFMKCYVDLGQPILTQYVDFWIYEPISILAYHRKNNQSVLAGIKYFDEFDVCNFVGHWDPMDMVPHINLRKNQEIRVN